MNIAITILICVLMIVLSIVVVALFVFKEEEIPLDETLFEHYMPQYSDGYTQGVILETFPGTKRTGILFSPRDVDKLKKYKLKRKHIVKKQLVFFENNKLQWCSKGSLSSRRHVLKGLPPNIEELPEEMKKTIIGKALMKEIEEINTKQIEIDSVREGSKRKDAIIERQGDGEVSLSELERIEELTNAKLKSLAMGKQDANKPGFNPIGSGGV